MDLIAFDLDGVVADTEPLHKLAKERILSEIGCDARIDLDSYVGRPNSDFWGNVIQQCDLSLSHEELERRQYDFILEYMHDNRTPMTHGLADLLDSLSEAGIRCALCSSSDRYYVDRVLAFFDLGQRFSPIVGGDQVERKKPAPDGYRKVVRDANLVPDRVIAIEDSSAGVAAAIGAGLRCIGYINPTSGRQDLGAAFFRASRMGEIADWVLSNIPGGYAGAGNSRTT
jgi:HAD superfamily hydrolase (TIGR01509 family)